MNVCRINSKNSLESRSASPGDSEHLHLILATTWKRLARVSPGKVTACVLHGPELLDLVIRGVGGSWWLWSPAMEVGSCGRSQARPFEPLLCLLDPLGWDLAREAPEKSLAASEKAYHSEGEGSQESRDLGWFQTMLGHFLSDPLSAWKTFGHRR